MTERLFTEQDQILLEEMMLHRRDVRGNNFTDKDVEDDVIEKILHAASLAPSVGFSQPWEFVIVRDEAIKNQVVDSFDQANAAAEKLFTGEKQKLYSKLKLEGIREAPINIAVFYKPSSKPVLGQTSMVEAGEYSVVCAIQNMWLMSRVLNVGMGWVSILNADSVKKILKSPPENKLVAYLCLGYVKEFLYTPELERLKWEKRKAIKSVIFDNTYS